MAYIKNEWEIGSPITRDKMQHIEDGIFDAYTTLNTKANSSDLANTMNSVSDRITSSESAITTINSQLTTVINTNAQVLQIIAEVQAAHQIVNGSPSNDDTLAKRFARIEDGASATNLLLTDWINLIIAAYQETAEINAGNAIRKANSLKEKITDMDTKISTALNQANTALSTLGLVGSDARSMTERLWALDGDQVPSMNVPAIINEITTARGTNSEGAANGSLSARFSADESRIELIEDILPTKIYYNDIVNSLESNATNKPLSAYQGKVLAGMVADAETSAISTARTYADTNKVDKNDIANNLTTTDSGRVLDARQGKAIDTRLTAVEGEINDTHLGVGANNLNDRFANIDEGTIPERTLPSIIDEINAAHRTGLVNDQDQPIEDTLADRFGAIDNIIGDMNGSIADRIDAIDNAETGTVHGLDIRLTDAENTLETARTSSVVKETITEIVNDEPVTTQINKTYNSLDDRLEAIETDVKTIATELDMYDVADNINGMTSRLDTVEENIVAMGKEIGMLQDDASVVDLSTAVSRNNTRVDTIEGEIHDAHRNLGIDEETEEPIQDTLDRRFDDAEARITAAEDDISDINTNLGAEFTSENTVMDAINAAEAAANAYSDTNKVDKTDIYNNLDRLASGAVLDARQGKVLDDRIDELNNLTVDLATNVAAAQAIAEAAPFFISDMQNKVDATNEAINRVSNTIVLTKSQVNFTQDYAPTTLKNGEIHDKDDYLIQSPENDKYYYWKHIGNEWHLMGGAGSSNNAGYDFLTEAAYNNETKEENTDYYVTKEDGTHHYRYVKINNVLTEIEIGNFIRRYNMTKTYDETNQKYYLNLYEYGYDEAFDDTQATLVTSVELPEGGGGGGSSTAVTRVIRVTPANVTTVLNDNHIYLRYFYSSVDVTGESHEATYTLKYNNGSIIASGTINSGASDTVVTTGVWPEAPRPVGYYELDVTNYCRLGTQTFSLAITTNGQTINRTWTVNIIELRLTSSASESIMTPVGESIRFPYTPFGALSKTLYVKVDNTDLDPVVLGAATSGNELEYIIPSQAHGTHTISMYLKAVLDGEEQVTETITRDYIWYDTNNTETPILIASPYRGKTIESEQYAEVEIPYTVYNKNESSFTVEYYYDYVDGQDNSSHLIDTITLNRTNGGTLRYAVNDSGNHTLTIKVGEVIATFNLVITELPIDVSLVSGAVINFDPSTLSNNSANRLPTWTYDGQTYHMTVSDNFNWSDDASGGGYKEDVDGKCFVIKAGTWAEFDYKMFKQLIDNTDPENPVFNSSVFERGAEMKVIFKVTSVRDASAVWFTNAGSPVEGGSTKVGIQLSAHEGWLKTSGAITEGENASTNSYLYFPYSEEDKIELDINVNRQGNNENFIMSYEDGVPSKAYAYETTELLYQASGAEAPIRIGSPDCDVHIYKLRIYDKSLATNEILRNFIGDGSTITEKVARYERNSVYYDSTKPEGKRFTPYASASAVLDPEQLAKKMPDVKILMLEAPTFTKSKATFVKSSLRCIHAEGGLNYPARPNEDNWLFVDGYHAGQGTTSDNYGQSARNVDFLFMSDGTHAPTKKKNISGYEGYVSKLYKGENNSTFNPTSQSWEPAVGAIPETCLDWMGDECKVSLTSTSIPNNYFNLKVNVASSENVNNALLQKRYNDFLPYISPAKARDSRIKNDMEFVPAVLFIRETDTTKDENDNYINHLEFNDTNWHFYALGNIGDSKKTDYTRAYDPDDMNEFTVEISDNNTANSQFQSGVYMNNGVRTVETSDSGINSMNYIWGITDQEWNAMRDPTEDELANRAIVLAGGDAAKNKYDVIMDNGKVYVNYRHRLLVSEPFDGKHSFEFRYACKGDYRDGDLINKTSGGDDDVQFDINRKVVEAFYDWIVTATDEQFVNEIEEWCVPDAVEFFYAFTHFYTMMDNRAKNCFWHFAKTGTHRAVSRPVPALLHVYDELVDNAYVPTEDTSIVEGKQYYTEYAFDLWTYDTDTAIGIDNNGELVFPYGKEDTDYRVAGVPSSGYVFNGAGSIFWRRLSSSFTNEIADVFNRVNEQACFDSANLITQFDTFQNCYPEEIWRKDIERKYIRTFTGKSYDNSKLTDNEGNTKQNPRFLKEMMQGRKKYQRRQWVRDQSAYFGSKYMLNNIRNNTIEMVCYTPAYPLWESGHTYLENEFVLYENQLYKCAVPNNDSTFNSSKWIEGVTPDYHLKITPYQDMYINVAVGNGNLRNPVRAVAGQEYTIDCTANMNETRIYIYGGSYIQALSNLAPMYIGANIFSSAAHLKKLDLGTDNPTYHNTNLTTLTILPNMPILEELNIKNCDNLGGVINLGESNNLRVVEAEGTTITSIKLPDYTKIETLHLPSTVNAIALKSARSLTSFYMTNKTTGLTDYSGLININVTDSDYSAGLNWLTIASGCLNNIDTLYLQDLRTSSVVNITDIQPFLEKKTALETTYDTNGNLINKLVLSGTVSVTGEWSEIEKTTYETVWPNLTFSVIDDSEHKKVKYRLTYQYEINGVEQEYSIYVNNNASIEDIYDTGVLSEMPSRPSTAQYNYVFGSYNASNEYIELSGWKVQGDSETLAEKEARIGYVPRVTGNTTIVAVFNSEARRYPVKWFMNANDTTPVKTNTQIPYGGGTTLEAPTVTEIHEAGQSTSSIIFNRAANPVEVTYKIFNGWDKLPININPSATDTSFNIYANWIEGRNVGLPTLFEDTSNLTPVQLLAFANMTDEERAQYVPVGKQFTIQTGYEGMDESGELLIGPGAEHIMTNSRGSQAYSIARFDSNSSTRPFESSLQPLKANNDEFTLAIDYAFNQEAIEAQTANEAVLMACYEKTASTTAGFRLYYRKNEGPKISFGDTTVDGGNANYSRRLGTPTTAKYRNMLVLRHPKNSSVLYIYSGVGTEGNRDYGSILTDIYATNFIQTIEWSNVNTDAKLVFGNLSLDNDSSTMVAGKGIIYWAKYWNKDLGVGECRKLASWNHESMTFAIEEYSGMNAALGRKVFPESVTVQPNVVITSMNASSYGHLALANTKTMNELIQWPDSKLQAVANKRIFNSLPTALQSIITKSPVRSRASKMTNSGYTNAFIIGDTEVTRSNDYIFFPSSVEYGNEDTENYKGHEAAGTMNWKTPGHVELYNYNSGTGTWNLLTESVTIDISDFMNIRFPNVPLKTQTANRVFMNYNGSEPIYGKIDDIQRGDIVIYNDTDAYIYVSSSDIAAGMPTVIPANNSSFFYCSGGGGWVKAENYWTRSPFDNNGTYATFMYVNSKGSLVIGPTNPDPTGYGFNYSFSI